MTPPGRSREQEVLSLFPETAAASPDPVIRPWRTTLADDWLKGTAQWGPLDTPLRDLLRRDLEFLAALDRAEVPAEPPGVARFKERHDELLQLVCLYAEPETSVATPAERLPLVRAKVEELRELRLQILQELETDRLRRVLAAEPRVRIREADVAEAIALARFKRAEERGELQELVLTAPEEPSSAHEGFVESFASAVMKSWVAEQERRPLPARGGLATLLSQTPGPWLDAAWEALGLGASRPSYRKEREREITRLLTDPVFLRDVVEHRLTSDERRLLAYLVEKGGQAPVRTIARLFGDSGEDGWFWNEEPPTSTLGRVRLHALAFVGVEANAERKQRIVLVPRELPRLLGELL